MNLTEMNKIWVEYFWNLSSKGEKSSCFDKNAPLAHKTQVTRLMSPDIMTNHSVRQ